MNIVNHTVVYHGQGLGRKLVNKESDFQYKDVLAYYQVNNLKKETYFQS